MYPISMNTIMYEILSRRSFRAMSREGVTDLQVRRIVEAGHLAPSCFNNQPWRFIVYRTDEQMQQISKALSGSNNWAERSAFIVAVLVDPAMDCRLKDGREYALFDAGLAVENMLLQAVHEGLYAHPMAGFSPSVVREVSHIPENYQIVTLVAFGFPGSIQDLDEGQRQREGAPRERKELDSVLYYGKWPDAL